MKSARAFFLTLFCLYTSLWATQIPGTIILLNDSPYILTASVYTHSGDYLGQATLQPGEQKNFTTNLFSTTLNRPGKSDVSITPYRVMWTCAGGGVYSTCHDGPVGGVIRANSCPGQLSCSPKEEEQKPPAEPPKGKTQKK
jgi:hypothetical protein